MSETVKKSKCWLGGWNSKHDCPRAQQASWQHARLDRVVARARLRHMAISDDETTRLAGREVPKAGSHERISLRGTALVFFAALAVFSLASVCARSVFPRGVKGRAASSKGEQQLGELASSPAELEIHEGGHGILSSPQLVPLSGLQQEQDGEEVLHSLSPVHVTTAECTGDRSVPVVKGVDFVAYGSLEGGQPAVYGSEQYSAIFQDYLFYFSSFRNKLLFEEDPTRYVPAWGGFCSYGIAHENVWNEANLGPASNPDYWLMVDGVLHLFRSSVPLGKFAAHTQENIGHGTEMWQEWFAGATATPFNTGCFCTVETCVDA